MFSENKLEQFSKKIIKLEDRPQMSAQALKEYFDSSAEELRVKFNALIDALDTFGAESLDAVDYNAAEYKLTFSFKNGSTQTIDLPLELLIESGHYDADAKSIVLTLANSDVITIPVSDLVDEYEADEKTLHMTASETSRVFSVKDGVFASEAPADGALYARTNGGWKEIIEGLPHIKLSEAVGITGGLYVVDDAFADWSVGTSENPLTCALLIAGVELYGMGYENSCTHQMLVLPSGELWSRAGAGEWESVIPSLDGYAKTVDVHTAVADIKRDRKLKLLKTITLEEDVRSIKVEFDKPVDEVALLMNVVFLTEESKAIAARGHSTQFLFYETVAMKTSTRFFYAHCRHVAEQLWETTLIDEMAMYNNGLSDATRNARVAILKNEYTNGLEALNIFLPNASEGNAMKAGSVIEIWGHEADENL